MKVTLYKNCIFTNTYNEVCDVFKSDQAGRTTLDSYLERLDQVTYDVDYAYIKESGFITLPPIVNSIDFYNYNYLKFTGGKFIRYCFIDNIELRNQLVVIYYSVDYWHSYAEQMNFRYGVLTNTRSTNFSGDNDFIISRKMLPLNYEVREVTINQINTSSETNPTYYLLAQCQRYLATTSGEVSSRELFSVIVGNINGGNGLEFPKLKYNMNYKFTYSSALEQINKIVLNQSNLCFYIKDNKALSTYYEIDNFTLIPTNYDENNVFADFVSTTSSLYKDINSFVCICGLYNTGEELLVEQFTPALSPITTDIYNKNTLLFTREIEANYLRQGIGTINHNFSTAEIGKNYNLSLYIYIDDIDIKLNLYCQDKVIDVTDDFVIDFPVNSISGAENAQRKMARTLSNISNAIKIGEGVGQIIADIYTYGGATKASAITSGTGQILSNDTSIVPYKQGYANWQSQYVNTGDFGYTVQDVTPDKRYVGYNGNANSAISGVGKIGQGIVDLVNANASLYVSNTAVMNTGLNTLAIFYGICEIMASEVLNEEQVENAINFIGYNVNEIVSNDIFYTDDNENYNIIKFGSVVLNAPSQNIANRLKEILLNGVKIWYNYEAI